MHENFSPLAALLRFKIRSPILVCGGQRISMFSRCKKPRRPRWAWLLATPIAWLCLAKPAPGLLLAWKPSPDPSVVGYAVLYGTNSGSYTMRIDVGNQTNATIQLPKNGATYYITVVACAFDGMESLPSNEVSYVPPGGLSIFQSASSPNQLIRFSVGRDQEWQLQVSEDLVDWRILSQITALADGWIDLVDSAPRSGPARFYRLASAPRDLSTQGSNLPSGALLVSRSANAPNIQIRFSLEPAGHWQLEASEDLVQWVSLCEISAQADGWIDVFDPIVPCRSARFYRLGISSTFGGNTLDWVTGNKISGWLLSATELTPQ